MEAFFKLLKISGSIETLILSNTGLMNILSIDFCNSLGQNKTLQHLYLNVDKSSKYEKTSPP